MEIIMRLVHIQKEKYKDYRIQLMFEAYKWDPQFLDNNTIAEYALVITEKEHEELKRMTEALDVETIAAEEFLNNNQTYAKSLLLNKKLKNEIIKMQTYKPEKHIRLMRYDFHPTVDGKWAVSEVNSDVPGGFAEASVMPKIAMETLDKIETTNKRYIDFGEVFVNAIKQKVKAKGNIMLVHCTCYSDDRQVMEFIGDRLIKENYNVLYGAVDHVNFKDNKAYSVLDGNMCELDGIIRFTPLEWLVDVKPKRWQGYFDTDTVSCNHPVAIFAQTKRFPLIWDELEKEGLSFKMWSELLPHTIDISQWKKLKNKEEYIFKPAYGRVGEKISIKEACDEKEYQMIMKEVRKTPKKYLAQKKFISKPLKGDENNEFHVCLGSYTIEGKHAGYYARISKTLRIDSNAADIPVLIERI